ncbi:hypothetical protein [Xenorhabdus bovienii]|uniref:Gp29 Protelomerase n=1 Tax=Xenorhabdus bovienii str. Intermedium TaxID=1379677 RepID=A0A077QK10_XENBV
MFFAEILGHDDENTQLHYKQFKLHNFSRTWKPDVGNENQRLESLQQLDDEMLDFARGDAGVRIHEAAKQIVEKFPNDLVTTSQLRALGFNIPLTKRYLEFTADALEQEPEPPPEVEKKTEQTKRPRFSASHRHDDGQWVVKFEYSGQNYSWIGQADNLKNAMIQAWQAYFS